MYAAAAAVTRRSLRGIANCAPPVRSTMSMHATWSGLQVQRARRPGQQPRARLRNEDERQAPR
eukprot:14880898-Alexandrium_andersonii.AAC.1